jgi:hypothetical protein
MRTATLLAAMTGSASAFWRMSCPSRIMDDLADPIVSPGEISGHVHVIAGGNGFDYNMTYRDTQASKCSSCPIKEDLSNYWTPKLFYKYENGSVTPVPLVGDSDSSKAGMTVYYQQRPGPKNDKLHAYPKGFRMIAGDPFKRKETKDFAGQAVSFACLDYDGPAKPETKGFPNYNCPNGLRAQVYFPSCWNGKDKDSEDHKSHMAYPTSIAYDNGPCPSSHPYHMISVFFEVLYDTNQFADMWYGDSQPFVFAMGDTTGYGMHGDFLNGWEIETLQAATNDCTADSGLIEDCPHFSFFEDEECQGCKVPARSGITADGILPKLPGCNPITGGPKEATPVEDCAATSKPLESKEKAASNTGAYVDMTSKGYRYIGCGTDDYYERTFDGDSTSEDDMTVEKCVEMCSSGGYKFAGLEYSSECYCGNTIAADRRPKPGVLGSCNMKCSGNSKEKCGGGSALSIYRKCADGGPCKNVGLTKRDSDIADELAEMAQDAAEVARVKARSAHQGVHARRAVHALHGLSH